MSKDTMRKLTLEDFLRKKEQRERDLKKPQTAELYIKSLDGYITVEEPNIAQLTDAQKIAEDSEAMGNAYIVYQCCPVLRSAELRGNGAPHEIVFEMFKPGEVQSIAEQLMSMAGYTDGNVTVVDKLKN